MRVRGGRLSPLCLAVASACSAPFEASVDAGNGTPQDGAGLSDVMAGDVMTDAADADADVAEADAAVRRPPVSDGLMFWVHVDAGLTLSSGTISNWADQSGSDLDGRQPDVAKRPKWTYAGLSGRPAAVFDGDDFLSLPAGFSDFSLGVSLFAVWAVNDASGTCVDVLHLSNGPEIDDIALGRHDGKVIYEAFTTALHGDDFPVGAPQLTSVVHAVDGHATVRLNAAPFATTDTGLPVSIVRLSNVIGRSLYAGCESLNGEVFEILAYGRALDTVERGRVEDYLRDRWDCCR